MSQKVRKTLIMIVMAALIICLMAASLTYTFTYGRYAGGKFDEESPYDDLIEFVGAREYTVRSPEELIQAIEDGYSNIVIAEDAEEPFVITEGVTDVTANLVLNLNGKTLIRNSRNPMLDVQTNVSVVLVYDSTNKGAFYNPVGSSLMASGGSLTVGSGRYESGPRAEEYENEKYAGTLGSDTNVTLFARSNKKNEVGSPTNLDRSQYISGYSLVSGVSLPTITPKKPQENNRETVRGNVYLNSDRSDWLPADTFLVYTVEENCFIGTSSDGVTFESGKLYVDAESETVDGDTIITASEFTTPLCNVASCDFYYYYPISGTAGTANSPQDYAVIYGYWDVMELARDDGGAATALKDSGLISPYGAVRMVEGEGIVRGGTFSNHFDAVNTYGIYAEGGTLSVSKNTKVDTTFTTGGEGVCIRVQSAEAEDKTTGGSLTISGGEFSSKIGNTIEMSGGNMTVTKGTFTKDATGADLDSTDNGSAIDIQGGTLTMTGSDDKTFTITGSHVNGIKSSGGGTVTAEHTTFSMSGGDAATGTEDGKTYGTDMFGINIDSGTVTANGCDITIYGTYSAGILSMGKNVDGSTVSVGAADNTASEIKVYVPESQESQKFLSSAGISSEGGKIQLTGNVNIETNGLGITARGPIYITGGEAKVTTTHGTGIYVSGATITNTATLTVESNITSGWSWVKRPENPDEDVNTNVNNGIYVENGSIDASAGTLNVTHTGVAGDEPDNNSTTGAATKSYAVFVKGDAEGGSQETTVSIGAGTITGTKAGGVYVVGTSKQDGAQTTYTATVTLGGVTVTARNTYAAGILTETGNVIINGNAQITSSALGIAVINGNVGISDSTSSSVTATRATGVYVRGGTLYNWGTLSVESDLADENNNNLFYQHTGADISTPSTDPNPYNGVYVYGGSLESTGTLNVTFTGVQNDQKQTVNGEALTGKNAYRLFEIKSYAVRVEAEEGVNTIVTIASGNILNGSCDENGNVKENSGVGGGVLVNGGKVTLGNSSNNSGPTVQTTGRETFGDQMDAGAGGNWVYNLPKTGGPAIKVTQSGSVSSTLTVYGGTYTAQQGDGIVTVGGESYIYSGTFIGKDFDVASGDRAGPGASYSFKVYGGTANVYGGTFGGLEDGSYINSSGAFVMGTVNSMGSANIYGGSFVVSSGNTGGQAGFSVYEYGNVLVDPGKGGEQQNLGGDVTMTGLAAGLVIEGNTSNPASVQISDGTFSSTRDNGNSDGIWYSNSSATLTISGGTFTGKARSGLWFDVTPQIHDEGWIDGHGSHYSTNVKITGGGFKGNSYAIYAKESGYWESGSWNERPSYAIGVNYIIVPESLLRTDGWSEATAEEGIAVGYGERNPDHWNNALEDTIIGCKKIAVGEYYIETWWKQN